MLTLTSHASHEKLKEGWLSWQPQHSQLSVGPGRHFNSHAQLLLPGTVDSPPKRGYDVTMGAYEVIHQAWAIQRDWRWGRLR